ncbi:MULTISPECIES: FAD:protein FMN transferase [Alcaligenes]|uniref:FAD:protein FMN transferase n=1 Tax=Alcaligenes TaxID=507 RepID=UPI0002AA655E|nr:MULTISPECIES: FAD:protein FMN transferase [Alcaligenes]EKU28311.1 ApbE family protein 2 [Alcaligenes sp. HPC1271]ERI32643.1 thiamine biosynthesis protein ApbE [Alcaligenes sp. EGD-AK7]HRO20373.1 FAD:protein FMN transferase [Alcaligenes phenolicus]HRP14068.1 FAD:protein FMN transferase [Alcaligenes phenolicus]
MTSTPVSRRRFIGIVAATSALTCVPWAVKAMQAATTPLSSWQGVALGADAQLHIHHPDPVFAQTLIDQALSEVRRLERIFSLYEQDSALRRLNRDGYLKQAPGDLTRLLLESQRLSELTNGAFDPTVQVLWELCSQAAQRSAKTSIPDAAEIKQALKQVGYQAIHIQDDTIQLQHPGMALTLNGIAQGYITDRITEQLKQAGLEHALVDMGEIRSLGVAPGNRPWRVGLAGDPSHTTSLLNLNVHNQAISTSSGAGTVLSRDGSITHLFNPANGQARPLYRSVSVVAGNATIADALSTAFSWMSPQEITRVLASDPSLQAWVLPYGEHNLIPIHS